MWSVDPDRSPATLQATEGRLRRYLVPSFGRHQLRAVTVSMVRRWQNELRGRVGFGTVMACRSVLNRVLQAAEDDRRIDANPVPKVPAPKPPADPAVLLGRAKRRSHTPEELGRLLAAARPWCRDHFLTMAGTGMRPGELLGLRARRVDLAARRLEVLEVRSEAGRFGRGYKPRPRAPPVSAPSRWPARSPRRSPGSSPSAARPTRWCSRVPAAAAAWRPEPAPRCRARTCAAPTTPPSRG